MNWILSEIMNSTRDGIDLKTQLRLSDNSCGRPRFPGTLRSARTDSFGPRWVA